MHKNINQQIISALAEVLQLLEPNITDEEASKNASQMIGLAFSEVLVQEHKEELLKRLVDSINDPYTYSKIIQQLKEEVSDFDKKFVKHIYEVFEDYIQYYTSKHTDAEIEEIMEKFRTVLDSKMKVLKEKVQQAKKK